MLLDTRRRLADSRVGDVLQLRVCGGMVKDLEHGRMPCPELEAIGGDAGEGVDGGDEAPKDRREAHRDFDFV